MRQGPHLAGHHGEPASLLAGTRGFDGGVEREDVGLECDRVDDANDVAYLGRAGFDLPHRLHDLADHLATLGRDVGRRRGQLIRPARVAGALLDRSGDLLDAGGGALQTGCRIFGARRQIQIAGCDIGGCGVDAVAAVADLADDVAQRFGHPGQGIEQLRGLVFAVDPARGR